jgi:hypothetical protein
MIQQFTYEDIVFDYHLILENRRTIAIHVHPDQSVRVKAPLRAKPDKIHSFIQSKIRWVLKHRLYFAKVRTQTSKEYISGESFSYLGQSYKLQVRHTTTEERVMRQAGTLTVYSFLKIHRARTRKLLDQWYAEQARAVFQERLRVCAARFGLEELPTLAIRRMTSRWGSYSSGTYRICLNLELIKAPRKYIDYILIHELCHITHGAHNKAFYKLLSSHLPEWKTLKSQLESSLNPGE